MAPSALIVNHLLFVDDNLLLFKSSVKGVIAVSNLLNTYCSPSGQWVNHDKSSIFFSKGCPRSVCDSVKDTLNVWNGSLSDHCLGMPTDVG